MGYALCGEEKSQRFGIKGKDFPTERIFSGYGFDKGKGRTYFNLAFLHLARGVSCAWEYHHDHTFRQGQSLSRDLLSE